MTLQSKTRNAILVLTVSAVVLVSLCAGCQPEPTVAETKKMFTSGQKDPGTGASGTTDTAAAPSAPANPSQDDAKK